MVRGQLKSLQDGDHAAGSFGDGRVFDEQSAPNNIGFISFGECPVVFGSHVRIAKEFGFEVVIGQKLINSPQTQIAESGSKQMSVNVNERYGRQDLLNRRGNLWTGQEYAVIGSRNLRR